MKRLTDKETRGIIYLYKNNRMIREQKFFRRYDRKRYMKQFTDLSQNEKGDKYHITVLLDI